MAYLLDSLYLLALLAISPYLCFRAITVGKYRRGIWHKFTGAAFSRKSKAPCAWFHGVSVGEIHLLRQVVRCFQERHPDWDCVVSTTTDTGFDEARKHFSDSAVFYWPLDFSWAVRRALRRIRPGLLILAEGELWPNILTAAKERSVKVAVVNARMSPKSFRRWQLVTGTKLTGKRIPWFSRLLSPVSRLLFPFSTIDLFTVQTQEYANCFEQLDVPPERVCVTGSVKYDGVQSDRQNPRTGELRRILGVAPEEIVWIAGSTQAPEEEIALRIYRKVKTSFPHLRLFLVPRQKDRFDEVAAILARAQQPFFRRSQLIDPVEDQESVILVDTIGELGALWGLADIAFVGGSLDGHRGGQNMIEPAAYGAAVIFGPHVWNFRDTAARLINAGGAVQVGDPTALHAALQQLLADPGQRERLGTAARNLVRSQQGATVRTIDCLDQLIFGAVPLDRAA